MRSFPIDAIPEPYYEFQVDKLAAPVKGTKAPRYPGDLLASGISGCVLVQFVVDSAGLPEPETFKVLKTSHVSFAQVVLESIPQVRFTPAKVGANNVRQLVQQPYTFSIENARTVVSGHAIVMVEPGSPGRPRQLASFEQQVPPPPPSAPPSCN